MELQHNLERALHCNELVQWQGLLALVKCFNLIPRRPAYRAMIRLGIPKDLADTWINTLNDTT